MKATQGAALLAAFAAALLAAAPLRGDAPQRQQAYQDPAQRIRIWNYGAVQRPRGFVRIRMGAGFWEFNPTGGVSEFTVYTNAGKLVFQDSGENELFLTGEAETSTMLVDGGSELVVVMATGVVDGKTYDLTANLAPMDPPPPMAMAVADGKRAGPEGCQPGRAGFQVIRGILQSAGDDGSVDLTLKTLRQALVKVNNPDSPEYKELQAMADSDAVVVFGIEYAVSANEKCLQIVSLRRAYSLSELGDAARW